MGLLPNVREFCVDGVMGEVGKVKFDLVGEVGLAIGGRLLV